jgi:orotate phosphoribosyltransferase
MKNSGDGDTTPEWSVRKQDLGRRLLQDLYEQHLFKTWLRDSPKGWTLVSGHWTPFYIELRNLPSRPALFAMASKALAELIRNEAAGANRLIGLAAAGIPIASATALWLGMPMGFTRKFPALGDIPDTHPLIRDFTRHALVEGDLADGDRLAIVDDVVTKFTTKETALRQIDLEAERRGLLDVQVDSIVVLVDREQGAGEAALAHDIPMRSLVRLRTEGVEWLQGIALDREIAVIRSYLRDESKFQNAEVQEELGREAEAYQAG